LGYGRKINMAKQVITITISQAHSGGPVTIQSQYTTDGVVVKAHRSAKRALWGQTMDLECHNMARRSAIHAVETWMALQPMF
jgi:regulator of RNase E activity RraA